MRSRNYCFIVYPMLTRSDWIDFLKSVCEEVYCSPIHSGIKDGREIVDHYHVFVVFKYPKRLESASFWLASVRPVCLMRCHKDPFIKVYDAKLK